MAKERQKPSTAAPRQPVEQGLNGGRFSPSAQTQGRGKVAPTDRAPAPKKPNSSPISAQKPRQTTQNGTKPTQKNPIPPSDKPGDTRTFPRVKPAAPAKKTFAAPQKPQTRPAAQPESASAPGWRRVRDGEGQSAYRAPHFEGGTREYIQNQGEITSEHADIRSQTPSARRAKRKENRRGDLAKLRRSNFRASFRVVSTKKTRPKDRFRRIFTVLALYLIAFGIMAACFFGDRLLYALQPTDRVNVVLGEKGKTGYFRYEDGMGNVVFGETMYLNMTRIAEFLEFTTTGDLVSMRYFTRNDKVHEIVLIADSRLCLVNGTPVMLALPTVLQTDTVFVSSDLLTRFFEGISVEWNEKYHNVYIKREVASTGVLEGDVYREVTFVLKEADANDAVVLEELPLDLRMRIEAAYASGGGFIDPGPQAPIEDETQNQDETPSETVENGQNRDGNTT